MTIYNEEERRDPARTRFNYEEAEGAGLPGKAMKIPTDAIEGWEISDHEVPDFCGPGSEWVCLAIKPVYKSPINRAVREFFWECGSQKYILKVSVRKRIPLEDIADRVSFLKGYGYLKDSTNTAHFYCIEPVCEKVNLRQRMRSDPHSAVKGLADMINKYHNTDLVIHNDIKEEHLVYDPGSNRTHFALIDWSSASFARRPDDPAGRISPESIHAGGTPEYEPNERLHTESAISSPASDYYSIGIMLYKAVTGRNPYKNMSPAEVRRQKWLRLDVGPVADKDPELANLIAGLTADFNFRFTATEMYQYAAGKTVRAVYYTETDSGGYADSLPKFVYTLGGAKYHTPDELASGLLEHPDDALCHIRTDTLRTWLIQNGFQDAAALAHISDADYADVTAIAYALTDKPITKFYYGENVFQNTTKLGEWVREELQWDAFRALCRAQALTMYFSQDGFKLSDAFKDTLKVMEEDISNTGDTKKMIELTYVITPPGEKTFFFAGVRFTSPREFMDWLSYNCTEERAMALNKDCIPLQCWITAVRKETLSHKL